VLLDDRSGNRRVICGSRRTTCSRPLLCPGESGSRFSALRHRHDHSELIWLRANQPTPWRKHAAVVPRPDGQISDALCALLVCLSSPFHKNILIFRNPKSLVYFQPSCPTRGAVRDRHGRGSGCGGRGSADNERCGSGRRSRVVLTPRRWRQVCGKKFSLMTVARKPGRRGEHEGSR
jgi:hypothetical protein